MSYQIPTATIQSYSNLVMPLLQQKGSVLMNRLTRRNFTGKNAKVLEQTGKQTVHEITTRHADSVYNDTPHAARWLSPRSWAVHDMIDKEDKLKMLIDATPAYADSQVYAMGRKIDKLALDAAIGTAYVGENGTTTEAFDSDYQVSHGGTGLTFDKVRHALRLLAKAQVDMKADPLVGAIASEQYFDLLGMTQYSNADYNGSKPVLMDGGLIKWMGIDWVHVDDNLLPKSSTTRSCIVMAKSGICVGLWDDISTKVDVLPTKNHTTQISTYFTANATRLENGRVIEVQCTESA